MPWQMLVIMLQLSAGAALVSIGLRFAAQLWVAGRAPKHRERIEERMGRPLVHRGPKLALALAAAATGAVLLATIDKTADSLEGQQLEPWER